MDRNRINDIVSSYSDDITIGVLGSHSALEIGHGAKQEGYKTLVVCEKGREKTYTDHYSNLFDEVLVLDNFQDMVNEENQEFMRENNTIFVPNRSFSVYVGYDNIEEELEIPLLGSRNLLRTEERDIEGNQYDLLDAAGITKPKMFDSPSDIDRTVIVKVPEKTRSIERAFFYANTPEEYHEKANDRIEKGIIDADALEDATIEEYVKGAKFNANYFWSPIKEELDLLGFDRRIQTDLDGVLDLPADEQLELGASPQNVEIGHMGATMRESQIEMIFEEGIKFVEACEKEYPPGIIGLFALQGAVTKELEFYVFDVSPRIPGCPCVEPTSPYMKYKYMKDVGPGRRVAMEIETAIEKDEIEKITT
ncbi:5-formaminoimidazole-4-carboxamide-1-beta-D-ribofuranosyl 5'-monophosphate synthetase [Methanonatronarchaeum thermophilum]|uniref:5-formaminoimidazole-4-carboxamide-1-beta-D-ribofuranosyl 5'-monophosphate synthetase n=1 Tax=Methanonatronarchaeum thermophilum TaxID=1927129 RepID=A0A1Y3GD53_9EURY|nr:formate--phosphoribosylaminoimidazolecarboxamide ligase family protein [Methanonatronarchaeum thermophilum]OUJ19392.1 5-formaminoimidazole-4-carboxamide-1-beta-D-ribofuranosyl 5'-monophosphate synthetase [Methanonatronarchaeum thermophilum]